MSHLRRLLLVCLMVALVAGLAWSQGDTDTSEPNAPIPSGSPQVTSLPATQHPNVFVTGPGVHGAYLHGTEVIEGTAIFPGEQLKTSDTGQAMLARADGGAVSIGHSTAVIVDGTQEQSKLHIESGYAEVYGATPVQTAQGDLQPSSPNASYEVVSVPGKTYVLGLKGDTMVNGPSANGQARLRVAPDHAYVLTNANGKAAAQPITTQQFQQVAVRLKADGVDPQERSASPIR